MYFKILILFELLEVLWLQAYKEDNNNKKDIVERISVLYCF